jgi:hypothetical protein
MDFTPLEDIRPFYPLLNLTKMIGTSAADIPLDCFRFGLQFSDYLNNLYAQMGSDPSVFLQAFLFTQMGNANKFRKAMVAI